MIYHIYHIIYDHMIYLMDRVYWAISNGPLLMDLNVLNSIKANDQELAKNMMKLCYLKYEEEYCLRMVFNSNYFWLRK